MVREIALPDAGSASGFSAKKTDKEVYFTFTNYVTPTAIFRLEPDSGTTEIFKEPKVEFNRDDYETKQVFYNSKDGTRIPIMITHKKGIELNGKNPAMLYGYGGFNSSVTPAFSVTVALCSSLEAYMLCRTSEAGVSMARNGILTWSRHSCYQTIE